MKKKFIDISKLMLKEIFSYISDKKKLEIIKYNKKIQNKLDITKFIYQKIHFNSIVTQTTLDNPFILLEKNKFDKETLDKLISEWKEEIEEADIPEKEWNEFTHNLIYKDRFSSSHKVVDVIKSFAEKCTVEIKKGQVFYRARIYRQDPLGRWCQAP